MFLIRRALEFAPLDFDFELASNGEEALKIVSRVTPDGKFDGMILDLNLTTHSGIDILKHVRGTPELAGTPVIILTSSDSPRDMESAGPGSRRVHPQTDGSGRVSSGRPANCQFVSGKKPGSGL